MATATRAILCELQSRKPGVHVRVGAGESGPDQVKIVLQPRLCTLRSYGSGVMKSTSRRDGGDELSPFMMNLYEYIESTKKSQDYETIFGRLAMIAFAATISVETVTGNSLFKKMDMQGIAEAGGVCLAAVASAATFAWLSSARNRVGRILTVRCNAFIDALIDNIVDGLFYESDLNDFL